MENNIDIYDDEITEKTLREVMAAAAEDAREVSRLVREEHFRRLKEAVDNAEL